jgi:hypothetical protein
VSEHGSTGLPDHGVKLQGKGGQATNVAVNRSLEVETSGSARMAPRLHRACGLNARSDDMVQEPLAIYGREDVRISAEPKQFQPNLVQTLLPKKSSFTYVLISTIPPRNDEQAVPVRTNHCQQVPKLARHAENVSELRSAGS